MGSADFFSKNQLNSKVVDDLIEIVESDPKRRYEALVSLKKIGNPKAIDTFYKRLHDRSSRIRRISILALGEMGDTSAIYYLSQVVETHDFSIKGSRYFGHTENITLAKEAIQKIQQRNIFSPPSSPLPNVGQIWTNDDIQLLRQSWGEGKSIEIIANLLERSPDAVVHKLIETLNKPRSSLSIRFC
jgi:hypothetical protein